MFKWGIVSTGKIAQDFAAAIGQLPGHEVRSVLSRGDASSFIAKLCPHASASLTDVDAVYVATPPETHASLTRDFLDRGIPVLCEKPLATTLDDVRSLIDASSATNTFLMEGMWTRCFPATAKARELLGKIGDVVAVQGEFGYDIANGCPASVRGDPDSGGMTYDIGLYLAEKALLAFPATRFNCTHATATAVYGDDHVDLSVAAALRFEAEDKSGVASLAWTGLADTPETATIIGTRGALIFDVTAHTPSTVLLRERVDRLASTETRFDFPPPDDDARHAWNYPGSINLQHEALAVERAVKARLREASEWNHHDCLAAHTIIHQLKAFLNQHQPP